MSIIIIIAIIISIIIIVVDIIVTIICMILIGGFQRWFNLTLVNISADDADDYTCVGVNDNIIAIVITMTITIMIINNNNNNNIPGSYKDMAYLGNTGERRGS